MPRVESKIMMVAQKKLYISNLKRLVSRAESKTMMPAPTHTQKNSRCNDCIPFPFFFSKRSVIEFQL
jgi:hypothetical protein